MSLTATAAAIILTDRNGRGVTLPDPRTAPRSSPVWREIATKLVLRDEEDPTAADLAAADATAEAARAAFDTLNAACAEIRALYEGSTTGSLYDHPEWAALQAALRPTEDHLWASEAAAARLHMFAKVRWGEPGPLGRFTRVVGQLPPIAVSPFASLDRDYVSRWDKVPQTTGGLGDLLWLVATEATYDDAICSEERVARAATFLLLAEEIGVETAVTPWGILRDWRVRDDIANRVRRVAEDRWQEEGHDERWAKARRVVVLRDLLGDADWYPA